MRRVVTLGALAAIGAAFVVWFVGFDVLWAVAAVLIVGPVTAAIATVVFDDTAVWEPPARETPRGIRLEVTTIEQSLAACDRLAAPRAVRRARAVVATERDDREARLMVVRRMRALLLAEVRHHGLDAASAMNDEVAARFGPEALVILQPHDDAPVRAVDIAQCLETLERLTTDRPRYA